MQSIINNNNNSNNYHNTMRIMTVHTMDPELQDTEAVISTWIYRKENV